MALRIILGLISGIAALASLFAAYAVVYFHWDAGNPHSPEEIETARWGYHIWTYILCVCLLAFGGCLFFFMRTFKRR